MSSAKENILNKIKKSKLAHSEQVFSVSAPTEIYKPILPDAITCFKNELENISGICEVFDTEDELYKYLQNILFTKNIDKLFCREEQILQDLSKHLISHTNDENNFDRMQAAVTSCIFLVARTGSVIITSASQSGRQLASFPPIHIVLADISQLVNYPEDAYQNLSKLYGNNLPSQITTITGPSRTADIEKTLVLGAHGPKEFIVLLCKEKSFHNFAIQI